MAISIKSIGGSFNEVPNVTNLKVTAFGQNTIDIEYKIEDVELTICRHYLYVNGGKKEITKEVGYESDTNVFKHKITGLKMNTPYTIQIGASDGLDEGLSKAIQQTTKNYQLFGVRVMENNSNPSTCCTYIEDAVGISVATPTSLGGWADKFPFNKIRIVGFKNGTVTKEIKPSNKTQYTDGSTVPTDVDVMVEIPKVYWKFTNITNGYEMRISNYKIDSSYDCYAHKVGGVEKDFIYVGAYLGYNEGGKLRSKSGVSPTTSATLTHFRTYANNVGSGYQQWNWFTLLLLQNLYLLAYKNLNSQNALGYGYVNRNSNKTNTGGTNTKGMVFGETGGKQQMCFLGIEDFWGNLYQFVDGMKLNGYNIMVATNNKSFNNSASGYENVGKTSSLGVRIDKVAHTNKGGFFPMSTNGSDTTYYCDFGSADSDCFGITGGSKADGLGAGAFCLSVGYSASGQDSFVGSRLVFLG